MTVVPTILLIAGILCLLAALFLLIVPRFAAAVPAYVGLCLLHWSTSIFLPVRTLVFWGLVAAVCLCLNLLLPKGEPDGRPTGNIYVALGSIVGMLLGMAMEARILVLGVIIGAFVGQFAFSRTPHGKWLKFPSATFIHYFCAKSLPAIATVAMLGIAIEGFIA